MRDIFDEMFKLPVPEFVSRDLLVAVYGAMLKYALKETEGGNDEPK